MILRAASRGAPGSAGSDRGPAFLHQPCRRVSDRYPLEGEFIGNRPQHALVELGRSKRRRRRIAPHLIQIGRAHV